MLDSFETERLHIDTSEPALEQNLRYQQQSPFTESVDLPYFSIASWEQHLDLLQHLSRFSKVLQVVVGEPQSGKSTLLSQLLQQTRDTAQVYSLKASPNFDLESLSRTILQGFNVAPFSQHEDVMNALVEQLDQLKSRVNPSLLLIDDAQDLPKETLAALLALTEQGSETLITLHIVLFGTPRVLKQLHSLQLPMPVEELTHVIELAPLTQDETTEYLNFRLDYAGFKGHFPFTTAQVERIWLESHGLPGRINELAQDIVANLYFEDGSHFGNILQRTRDHLTHIIGAGVVVTAFVLVLIFQNPFNNLFKPQAKNTGANLSQKTFSVTSQSMQPVINVPAPVNNTFTVPTEYETLPMNNGAPVVPSVSMHLPQSVPTNSNFIQPAPPTVAPQNAQAVPAQVTANQSAPFYHPGNATQPQVVPAAPQAIAQPVLPISVQTQSQNRPVAVPLTTVSTVPAIPKTFAPQASTYQQPAVTLNQAPVRAVPVINVQPVAPTPVKVIPNVQPTVANTPTPKAIIRPLRAERKPIVVDKEITQATKPAKVMTKHEAVELKGFYLQIVSLSDEERAKAFISEHHLDGLAQYAKVERDGKNLYVITYGKYDSQAAATAAANQLQAKTGLAAWVRANKQV